MSDIAVVGRFAGSTALGAVGSTSIFVTLFTGFLIGLSNGINVLVARFYGARSEKGVHDTVHSALIVSLAAGFILLVIGLAGSPALLRLLNTKEDLLPGAILYLRVYFLGMPALALYNYGSAVFSAIGETKKPLILPLLCRRAECGAQPVLCHLLPSGRGGRGPGQCAVAVCFGLADPAGADPCAGHLRPGLAQCPAGPGHDPEHPGPGSAGWFSECGLCHCKPVYPGRRQLL